MVFYRTEISPFFTILPRNYIICFYLLRNSYYSFCIKIVFNSYGTNNIKFIRITAFVYCNKFKSIRYVIEIRKFYRHFYTKGGVLTIISA